MPDTNLERMITFPNAKINLGLNITEKRPDGYHNVETIFYPVPVEDALEITVPDHPDCKFTLYRSGIPVEGQAEQNLAVKAYLLLDKEFHLPPVNIYLYKHIPLGAGLGGGSTDAAFMLKLLNERFGLSLDVAALEAYAAILGADCAFFIKNVPTFAEGIGNVFSPVPLSLEGYGLVIVKPEDVFVSTRDAFSHIQPRKTECSLKEIVARHPVNEWKDRMKNDFEESVFPQFPVIGEIKAELYRQGAVYAAMSGSGASVFGLFAPPAVIPEIDLGNKMFYFQCVIGQ
ncbi:4-diphosphocytidyl-2-C-methyl-D-erythritol kinase [termite gut metagenome]|uniref:4-(cytidine 5'-diphospho)-2-C-methyl-D-erythritol kinase n=1 Tax=termite gut metagenome TaxID=433724 RepID=A0A5J4S5Q3_9ZZZZ